MHLAGRRTDSAAGARTVDVDPLRGAPMPTVARAPPERLDAAAPGRTLAVRPDAQEGFTLNPGEG